MATKDKESDNKKPGSKNLLHRQIMTGILIFYGLGVVLWTAMFTSSLGTYLRVVGYSRPLGQVEKAVLSSGQLVWIVAIGAGVISVTTPLLRLWSRSCGSSVLYKPKTFNSSVTFFLVLLPCLMAFGAGCVYYFYASTIPGWQLLIFYDYGWNHAMYYQTCLFLLSGLFAGLYCWRPIALWGWIYLAMPLVAIVVLVISRVFPLIEHFNEIGFGVDILPTLFPFPERVFGVVAALLTLCVILYWSGRYLRFEKSSLTLLFFVIGPWLYTLYSATTVGLMTPFLLLCSFVVDPELINFSEQIEWIVLVGVVFLWLIWTGLSVFGLKRIGKSKSVS